MRNDPDAVTDSPATDNAPALPSHPMQDAATRVLESLERIARFTDRDTPLLHILVLMRIAQAGPQGVDQGRLIHDLKTSSAAISRTVRALGDVHYLKDREGYQLVQITLDPKDNRRRIATLTPKGQELLAHIQMVLDR